MYTYYKMPIELKYYINSHLIDFFKSRIHNFTTSLPYTYRFSKIVGMLYHQRQKIMKSLLFLLYCLMIFKPGPHWKFSEAHWLRTTALLLDKFSMLVKKSIFLTNNSV